MTATTKRTAALIEGPMREERWGSVGFRLDDKTAPRECRRAAAWMMEAFGLTGPQFPDLSADVQTMVSELVTNAQRHGGDAFPAGSFTLWHPNRWLILTVHDKGRYIPWRETFRHGRNPSGFAWGVTDMDDPDPSTWDAWAESGRGLQLVRGLAERHCGELSWARDGDPVMPGKVARVKLLLPNLCWQHTFRDPWTGRMVTG